MECRSGCGACCIVISISSSIPGMPNGKPAGVRCINLDKDNNCTIYKSESYPQVCSDFKACVEMCGETNKYAFDYYNTLEKSLK